VNEPVPPARAAAPAAESKENEAPVMVALEAPARLRRPALDAARRAAPGLLLAGALGGAGVLLSLRFGGPAMLFALLLGMACHTIAESKALKPGVDLAARLVLRIGVGLLGARITLGDVLALDAAFWLVTAAGVVATILFGAAIAPLIGRSREFGILTGGATAICGASAALAISAVLPRHANSDRDAIFAVIGVTTLSTIAMVFYPWLIGSFAADHTLIGVFLGATIHDVAQVVGAGYSVSATAGDTATITKLLRVAMLVPVVALLTLAFRSGRPAGAQRPALLPWFLFLFVALAAAGSAGLLGPGSRGVLAEVSRWCLITAIAALGMKTSLATLLHLGFRPLALVIAETVFLAALVGTALLLIG
jgi:uncharacterized integral membrane protein (TIGR00698 family)